MRMCPWHHAPSPLSRSPHTPLLGGTVSSSLQGGTVSSSLATYAVPSLPPPPPPPRPGGHQWFPGSGPRPCVHGPGPALGGSRGGRRGHLCLGPTGGGSSGSSGGARLSAERELGGGSSGSSGGQVASPVALRHHKDAVVATAWSHNGATLATADKAGSMAFWCLL